MRDCLYLAVAVSGAWACVESNGAEYATGISALSALKATYAEPREVLVQSSAELVTLLSSLPSKGRPDHCLIREKEGYDLDCAGFSYNHGAKYWLGAMLFPEKVIDYCRRAGWNAPSGIPQDAVKRWRLAHQQQQELVQDVAGIVPTHSLAGTAFKAAMPKSWRNGGIYFGKTVSYEQIRKACYGPRIEIFFKGRCEAVECDINSAYGHQLTLPLPDWQIYQRSAYPGECEWLDCTVEVSGAVGPLPFRSVEKPKTLDWPTSGRWRGLYTAIDLATPGVRVVEVHQAWAGRYGNELRKPVSAWLERRSLTSDTSERDTIRGLAVGLAGKLWQRPIGWGLWHLAEGHPPAGAVQIGDTAWMAYPTSPVHVPVTLPTTASYVTAGVRAKLWPHIADGKALYTHTDSVHLRLDDFLAGKGPEMGERPGEWSVKAEGDAHYKGINDYSIGRKKTGNYRS